MTEYYKDEDLSRFGEIEKYKPDLFKKFMNWYSSSLEPGILTKREKVLIGLAEREINVGEHCYGCTAGQGST
jgi:hypothetical protein